MDSEREIKLMDTKLLLLTEREIKLDNGYQIITFKCKNNGYDFSVITFDHKSYWDRSLINDFVLFIGEGE